MTTTKLFTPIEIGGLHLSNRVIMAPLTRMRATVPGNIANEMMAQYYAQRATPGGLIIAEASQVSEDGQGAPCTPGIHSAEQIAGWKLVTEAVHAKGGKIYLQLWHMGRLSHPSYQPNGELPIAPSAVPANVDVTTPDFKRVPCPTPRALETEEIPDLIERYTHAANCAKKAGFDGVEIHSANGYLLEQFLQARTNKRTDIYGGSIENRCRLVLEVTKAIAAVWGSSHVGIRLSPFGIANDSGEDEPMPLYSHLISELDKLGLAYLHLIEPRASGAGQRDVDHKDVPSAAQLFRPFWHGTLIAAGNFNRESANIMIASGDADAIAFGRLFISNPDLPERLRLDAPLNPYNRATFYSRGPKGYVDYPAMADTATD
ncbi:alkene reductase [Sneathiella litorea]|uniref:N-ethylmaleimide reductase n=1 Tax=Sneathiella litorea TaxID=2606216 RepID=A0A6L8WAW7_9PROT|nr:alkene reductase [Sneathiella litorea]MZR31602.1 N-ethylmaleimide reductase [Sneathiella litorea]